LCYTASSETRKLWEDFIKELSGVSPELANLCVKPCVYRNGLCPEVFSKCRFNTSEAFNEEMGAYLKASKIKRKENMT
jgi:hypothetical protein